MVKIGNIFTEIRGMENQKEVAARIGVTQQTWSSWEKGRRFPNNDLLIKIGDTFHISPKRLFLAMEHYKNR